MGYTERVSMGYAERERAKKLQIDCHMSRLI